MKDKITKTYQIQTPIYQTLSQVRKTIKSEPAAPIASIGKITIYGNYIFLNEPQKGIHIIDNTNPSYPKNISFINIPGNQDMAVQGSALYADSYGDLVTFDISNPTSAVTKNFSTNAFPGSYYYYTPTGTTNPDSINIIVGWNTKDTTVSYNPSWPYYYNPGGGLFNGCSSCMSATVPTAATTGGNSTGVNGSTARFTIINNFLYTVSYNFLNTFNISNNFKPASASSQSSGWNIETVYPFENKLFVGATSGMYMYDVQSSPDSPQYIGAFAHARVCDPVIADGNYAYVTLRSGTTCEGFTNELDILNISNMNNATLISTYPLTNPQGLSKDGNNLFICDGPDGLKIFDASDPSNLQIIKRLKDGQVHDVITQSGLAIVLGDNNVYEYDYSDISNIHLISKF